MPTSPKTTPTRKTSNQPASHAAGQKDESNHAMSKGFNMGGMNRNQMMQQARKMQEQLLAAQQKAAETEVSSTAGGGAVKVTAAGDMRIKSLTIDPSAIDPDDVEMLQDMILAAVNDALDSAETMAGQQMSAVTGGLNIPGLF